MALAFTPQAAKRVEEIRARYPDAQAACMPVLHLAQDEFGHLGDAAVKVVAEALGLPEAHVYGVVTFYTMFRREPAGKNILRVCTNVSCMLRGGYEVLERAAKQLGIRPGETTSDGKFTLIEEECLAACADAPATICGQRYYLRLTPEKIEQVIAELATAPQPEALSVARGAR